MRVVVITRHTRTLSMFMLKDTNDTTHGRANVRADDGRAKLADAVWIRRADPHVYRWPHGKETDNSTEKPTHDDSNEESAHAHAPCWWGVAVVTLSTHGMCLVRIQHGHGSRIATTLDASIQPSLQTH